MFEDIVFPPHLEAEAAQPPSSRISSGDDATAVERSSSPTTTPPLLHGTAATGGGGASQHPGDQRHPPSATTPSMSSREQPSSGAGFSSVAPGFVAPRAHAPSAGIQLGVGALLTVPGGGGGGGSGSPSNNKLANRPTATEATAVNKRKGDSDQKHIELPGGLFTATTIGPMFGPRRRRRNSDANDNDDDDDADDDDADDAADRTNEKRGGSGRRGDALDRLFSVGNQFTMTFSDPTMEAEYLAFFYHSRRDIAVGYCIVATTVSVGVQLMYLGIDLPIGSRVLFALVSMVWLGAAISSYQLKRRAADDEATAVQQDWMDADDEDDNEEGVAQPSDEEHDEANAERTPFRPNDGRPDGDDEGDAGGDDTGNNRNVGHPRSHGSPSPRHRGGAGGRVGGVNPLTAPMLPRETSSISAPTASSLEATATSSTQLLHHAEALTGDDGRSEDDDFLSEQLGETRRRVEDSAAFLFDNALDRIGRNWSDASVHRSSLDGGGRSRGGGGGDDGGRHGGIAIAAGLPPALVAPGVGGTSPRAMREGGDDISARGRRGATAGRRTNKTLRQELEQLWRSKARRSLCRNAVMLERILAMVLLANFLMGVAVYIGKDRCVSQGWSEDEAFRACRGAIQSDAIMLILIVAGAFLTPTRLVFFAPTYVVLTAASFAIRWFPGMLLDVVVVYFWSSVVVFSVEACVCIALVALRERSARDECKWYVRLQIRNREVARVRRQAERVVGAQVPVQALRMAMAFEGRRRSDAAAALSGGRRLAASSASDSFSFDDGGGSLHGDLEGASPVWGWSDRMTYCTISLDGYRTFSQNSGPSQIVEALQALFNAFDTIRVHCVCSRSSSAVVTKAHQMGDCFGVFIMPPKATATGSGHDHHPSQHLPAVAAHQLREAVDVALGFALMCQAEGEAVLRGRKEWAEQLSVHACLVVGSSGGALLHETRNVVVVGPVVHEVQAMLRKPPPPPSSSNDDGGPRRLFGRLSLNVRAAEALGLVLHHRRHLETLKAAAIHSSTQHQQQRHRVGVVPHVVPSSVTYGVVLQRPATLADALGHKPNHPRTKVRTAAVSAAPSTTTGSTRSGASPAGSKRGASVVSPLPLHTTAATQVTIYEPSCLLEPDWRHNEYAFAVAEQPDETSATRLQQQPPQQLTMMGSNDRDGERLPPGFSVIPPSPMVPTPTTRGGSGDGGGGDTATHPQPDVPNRTTMLSLLGASRPPTDDKNNKKAKENGIASPSWFSGILPTHQQQQTTTAFGSDAPAAAPPVPVAVVDAQRLPDEAHQTAAMRVALEHEYVVQSRFVNPSTEAAYAATKYSTVSSSNLQWSAAASLASILALGAVCVIDNARTVAPSSPMFWVIVGILATAASFLVIFMTAGVEPRFVHVATLLFVQASYLTAVGVADEHTVIGDSQFVWLFVMANWSLHRPPLVGWFWLWVRDAVVGALSVIRTVLMFDVPGSVRTLSIFFGCAHMVYMFVFQVLMERGRRQTFALQSHVEFLREEFERDLLAVQTTLGDMVPKGVAGALVKRAKQRLEFGGRPRLHPAWSTSFCTATEETPFLLVQLRRGGRVSRSSGNFEGAREGNSGSMPSSRGRFGPLLLQDEGQGHHHHPHQQPPPQPRGASSDDDDIATVRLVHFVLSFATGKLCPYRDVIQPVKANHDTILFVAKRLSDERDDYDEIRSNDVVCFAALLAKVVGQYQRQQQQQQNLQHASGASAYSNSTSFSLRRPTSDGAFLAAEAHAASSSPRGDEAVSPLPSNTTQSRSCNQNQRSDDEPRSTTPRLSPPEPGTDRIPPQAMTTATAVSGNNNMYRAALPPQRSAIAAVVGAPPMSPIVSGLVAKGSEAQQQQQLLPSFRILAGSGPLMGSVVGVNSLSFEYYGAWITTALGALDALEWGSCAATLRVYTLHRLKIDKLKKTKHHQKSHQWRVLFNESGNANAASGHRPLDDALTETTIRSVACGKVPVRIVFVPLDGTEEFAGR